ncbi:hypothetical protein [Prosthecobacter vanneervenii]|uniref:Uncharacterized protein n=1 Tax=Prosthecobacter vanneervenii TaxID=48466 RepID=A0A7W7YCE9_9BACT|nr:hypothetical protein [Prosthecobacter vanneervenii]MBB5033596.1 hypothetical protein [Prosthecobacter vanneervenii]
MNSRNSRRRPMWKLLGRLRSIIAVAPSGDGPWRSWEKASSREVQLEFDFEKNIKNTLGKKGLFRVAVRGQKVAEVTRA